MAQDFLNSEAIVLVELSPGIRSRLPVSRAAFRGLLKVLLQASGGDFQVEAALADDKAVQALNLQSTGLNTPTNVLSFPPAFESFCGSAPSSASGRMVLGVDTLNREAFLYGQDPVEHLVRLAAHGMAHLCGFDHGPAMDAVCENLEKAGTAFFAAGGNK